MSSPLALPTTPQPPHTHGQTLTNLLFSSPKEEVREIASKGGKASHGGGGTQAANDDDSSGNSGTGNQGFASMDPEKQVCVLPFFATRIVIRHG